MDHNRIGLNSSESDSAYEFLTEKQIKDILSNFNFTVYKLSSEIDLYKKTIIENVDQNKIDNDKIRFLLMEIEKVKKEFSKYKKIIDYHENELKIFKERVKSEKLDCNENSLVEEYSQIYFELKFFENTLKTFDIKSDPTCIFDLFLKEIENILGEQQGYYLIAKSEFEKNEEINKNLNENIVNFEKVLNKEKYCVHCHNYFKSKTNYENSCLYHPGKLKYYSCRGCGGDEYYTCCLKCGSCLKGCKSGRHASEF